MPELPEVEHAARSLGAQIVGRRIEAVTKLDWERMIETPAVVEFLHLLEGRKVDDSVGSGGPGPQAVWVLQRPTGGPAPRLR